MPRASKQRPGFEAALEQLESLVQRMESGEIPLDEALQCFQRGTELIRECQAILDAAQTSLDRIEQDSNLAAVPDGVGDE